MLAAFARRGRIGALLCGWLIAGCLATAPGVRAPAPPPVTPIMPIVQFADVPVPATFIFLSEESFRFEKEGLRVGLLRYRGGDAMDTVASFYREQMPRWGWSAVEELMHDRHILSFEKPGAACTITIENQGVDTRLSVVIAPLRKE